MNNPLTKLNEAESDLLTLARKVWGQDAAGAIANRGKGVEVHTSDGVLLLSVDEHVQDLAAAHAALHVLAGEGDAELELAELRAANARLRDSSRQLRRELSQLYQHLHALRQNWVEVSRLNDDPGAVVVFLGCASDLAEVMTGVMGGRG